jgi:transposase InsO family protein
MKLHANAALSLRARARMVEQVLAQDRSIALAAEAPGVSERTCAKWVARYRSEGPAGLRDRSSAPRRVHNRTDPRLVELLASLRRLRFTAPELADLLGMPVSTISGILKRVGMGRLGRLGLEPAQRYERALPGELIHIDVKKLGKISVRGAGHRMTGDRASQFKVGPKRLGATGWEFVHVAIDDATRLAYVEVLPNEKAVTAVGFLRRAVAHFASYGITTQRLITDNGSAYRSTVHAIACHTLGIRHLRTRPYRPQTNGKAERFIRTLTNGWAYGAIYRSSDERTAALDGWLHHYNHHRPHSAIGREPPVTRLNNLLGTYN